MKNLPVETSVLHRSWLQINQNTKKWQQHALDNAQNPAGITRRQRTKITTWSASSFPIGNTEEYVEQWRIKSHTRGQFQAC